MIREPIEVRKLKAKYTLLQYIIFKCGMCACVDPDVEPETYDYYNNLCSELALLSHSIEMRLLAFDN